MLQHLLCVQDGETVAVSLEVLSCRVWTFPEVQSDVTAYLDKGSSWEWKRGWAAGKRARKPERGGSRGCCKPSYQNSRWKFTPVLQQKKEEKNCFFQWYQIPVFAPPFIFSWHEHTALCLLVFNQDFLNAFFSFFFPARFIYSGLHLVCTWCTILQDYLSAGIRGQVSAQGRKVFTSPNREMANSVQLTWGHMSLLGHDISAFWTFSAGKEVAAHNRCDCWGKFPMLHLSLELDIRAVGEIKQKNGILRT